MIALEIFDVLGRRITTLINQQRTAEIYEQTFDASSLASGVYFYKLEAAGINSQNFTSTKKMILTNNP